jgi:hypothetical protein
MTSVKNSTLIHGTPGEIFDLVTTAKYWTRWHPATLDVSGQVQAPMKLGDVIRERARIGDSVGESDWTVTEWERPTRVVLSMPGTRLGDLKIEYRFVPNGDGVEFFRTLDFDATRFSPEIASAITAQMQSDSEIATHRIKELVEEMLGTQ